MNTASSKVGLRAFSLTLLTLNRSTTHLPMGSISMTQQSSSIPSSPERLTREPTSWLADLQSATASYCSRARRTFNCRSRRENQPHTTASIELRERRIDSERERPNVDYAGCRFPGGLLL